MRRNSSDNPEGPVYKDIKGDLEIAACLTPSFELYPLF